MMREERIATLEERLDPNEKQQALETLLAEYIKLNGGVNDVSKLAAKAIFPLLKISGDISDRSA